MDLSEGYVLFVALAALTVVGGGSMMVALILLHRVLRAVEEELWRIRMVRRAVEKPFCPDTNAPFGSDTKKS